VAGDQASAPQMTSADLVSGLPSALFDRPEKKPEEALDQNRPLVNAETLSLVQSERESMIKGIDEEDRTREQEMLTLGEALLAERQMLKDTVAKEVLNEVDLSYYYLTNDAFFNVLPVIEVNYFLSI